MWVKQQTEVIAFNEDCDHFHSGRVITTNNKDLVIMFNNVRNKKIGKVSYFNVSMITDNNSGDKTKTIGDSNKSLQVLKSVDMKALALLIKLLEFKMLFIKELALCKNKDYEGNSTDFHYFNNYIVIIDKYLKNVLLKLRIRENKDFELKDIQNNYMNILTKIKKSIKNDVYFSESGEVWLKEETDNIIEALNRKLEKKILFDISNSFDNKIVPIRREGEEEEYKRKAEKREGSLRLVKDCLGLIKCLQFEGDIELDKNGFYLRILEAINNNYSSEESNKKMHNLSNALFFIIEKFKSRKGSC